jgi:hypothetical protein
VKTTPAKAAKKSVAPAKKPAKRKLSATTRKHIADAQKKRWAAVRAEKAKKSAAVRKAAEKVPAKKVVAAKKGATKKAPAIKAKKAAPEKAAPASTEIAAS